MANLYRKIGVNVYTFMQKANLTPEELAKQMSYSLKDVWSLDRVLDLMDEYVEIREAI